MRALALVSLLAVACADTDPCAGHDGTCLALHVAGSGGVDQLRVRLDGVSHLDGATPTTPGAPHALPVTTAIFLPPVRGEVTLDVTGWLAAAAVGEATTSITITPGQHLQVNLLLGALSMSDLAAGDGALDLAQTMSRDQSMPDDLEETADLSTPAMPLDLNGDLAGTGPRRTFVLSEQSAALGPLSTVDGECQSAADAASLGGHYRAVIAYPTSDPTSHIVLGQGRDIVLPSGTKVATDATFFTTTHLSGIDELADGTPVTGCVFTLFSPNGDRISTTADCQGWTSTDSAYSGGWGTVTGSDINWTLTDITTCDTLMCHVYCIEQ